MKIVCAPQKDGVGLVHNLRNLRAMRARVVGLTEMDAGARSETHLVRRIFGRRYKVLVRDIGGHSEEIPLAVKVGIFCRVLNFRLIRLSRDVGERGVGNDRYLVVVEFRRFGKTYVVLHTHVDAVIQDHHTGRMIQNERTVVTAIAMETIEEQARLAIFDPTVDGVWVMGDLNILPVGPGTEFPDVTPWVHSPQAMFERLGMAWDNSRVVYMAWSKKLKRRGQIQIVPAHSHVDRADHGWLVGRFTRRSA